MDCVCILAKYQADAERFETLLSKEKAEAMELKGSIEQLEEQQARLTQEKQQLVTKVCSSYVLNILNRHTCWEYYVY